MSKSNSDLPPGRASCRLEVDSGHESTASIAIKRKQACLYEHGDACRRAGHSAAVFNMSFHLKANIRQLISGCKHEKLSPQALFRAVHGIGPSDDAHTSYHGVAVSAMPEPGSRFHGVL